VIEYPEHLGYYTARTLSALLDREDFERVDLRATGLSPGRIRSGLRAGRDSGDQAGAGVSARSADEPVRRLLESTRAMRAAKGAMNSVLSGLRLGDTLKALYRRR
jgi:hypothetical protein